MHIPKRKTWFLVVDGTKARLFESLGYREPWRQIEDWSDEAARMPARELESERPGRGHTIGAGTRYAIETRSEHDKAEETFVKARAKFVSSAIDDYDQLVLAASPKVLGIMRKALPADVTAKFIGVFDKDLTNMPDQELYQYFQKHLERW